MVVGERSFGVKNWAFWKEKWDVLRVKMGCFWKENGVF